MSDVGICGNAITPIAGTSAPLICDLPAGHDGWHGCDNAYTDAPMGRPWLTSTATRCHWTERLDLTWEDQLAAAERRGYDRAVANLRDRARYEAWWNECANDREHLESGGSLPYPIGPLELNAAAGYLAATEHREATKETDR